ncbi:MAG: Tll0287-like domain-containing protein [Nitrospiraceae bacterium]
MKRVFLWGTAFVLLLIVAGVAYLVVSAALRDPADYVGIEPAKVAEHLHAVIEANRTVYATHVVEKMQEKGIVQAAEHWKQEVALPLPAQFLIETGRIAAEKGSGVKYRLVSLWPIYVWNAPSTDFERKGLEAVSKDPDQPYTGFVKSGRSRYFQAIYADIAVSQACIDCHNAHPNSPRRDFKLKDVMGGIAITIPIDSK